MQRRGGQRGAALQNGAVPERWKLLDADAEERAAFASLDAVLALPSTAAAPPNRLRFVRRIEHAGRVYFLKIFTATQPKNRWLHHRLTQPRCGFDGEREAGVAAALLDRGIQVARPLAVGVRGAASYYLCAEVDGRSVADLRRAGAWDAALDADLARFCGYLFGRGVILTDLSTDHVFRTPDGWAVIDLHNGRVQTRPPSRKDLVRVLRRFVRSIRGLGVERARALRFGLRLLRAAAGLRGAGARAVIRRVPPLDTHGRYDAGDRSARYRMRNPKRTARELRLLRRVWPGSQGSTVLDSPCGTGRLGPTLRALGAQWLPADRSHAMLLELRAAGEDAPALQCDAARLPLADRSVDGVVCFRFLHHVATATSDAVLDEACRVADKFVVVSFFHPFSAHNWKRRLRERLRGTARTRFTRWPGDVRARMAAAGFAQHAVAADARWRRDLWVMAFTRVGTRA